MVLENDFHSDVSPVNNFDSDIVGSEASFCVKYSNDAYNNGLITRKCVLNDHLGSSMESGYYHYIRNHAMVYYIISG